MKNDATINEALSRFSKKFLRLIIERPKKNCQIKAFKVKCSVIFNKINFFLTYSDRKNRKKKVQTSGHSRHRLLVDEYSSQQFKQFHFNFAANPFREI
jgi:hypothetical protein